MKQNIEVKINDIPLQVKEGTTILESAQQVQVKIPTLCKHPDLDAGAGCGICIVKVKGVNKMLRACCTPAEDGMEVTTHDPEIVDVRRSVLELILSNHPNDCLKCGRNNNCELQRLAADFGIRDFPFPQHLREIPHDDSTQTIVLDPQKCILCGRCVDVCQNTQNVWALEFLGRGFNMRIASGGNINLSEGPCIQCGQCSAHCPTGAIFEHDDTMPVWKALMDPDIFCVAQIAPAVRVAVGEGFGMESGELLTKKIYAALKRMGFNAVFDTCFGADLTVMEEASEFIERFTKKSDSLPLITSCCPSWVNFLEKRWHDMIPHFSSAKSPHQMVGILSKTYYAQKHNIDPSKIFMVSVMPCTSKKYEITRSDEMFASGNKDIDAVLTTREFIRILKSAGIDFNHLPAEEPDHILGDYTGAGVIFGATGGVMEAALRTAYFFITKQNLGKLEFEDIRGLKGIKRTSIEIQGNKINIAVANGLTNVEHILKEVKEAKEKKEEIPYHFIEVMTCPGGCVGGGGQPYGVTDEYRVKRSVGLYKDDTTHEIRLAHNNPYIKKLYDDFLEKPLSKKSHHLLHTTYKKRPVFSK